MRDAIPVLEEGAAAKVAVITFDDGYADVFDNALPVLQEIGFTATCYFVSQCLGTYNSWDRGTDSEQKRLMSREQAAKWVKAGMEMGSHTRQHIRLTESSSEECFQEINGSKIDLEREFGVKVDSFSYPYGDYDDRVVSIVKAAGYSTAVTTRTGRTQVKGDPHRIRRVGAAGLVSVIVGVMTNYHNWRERRTV